MGRDVVDPFPSSPEEIGRRSIAVLPFPSAETEVGRPRVRVEEDVSTFHLAGQHDQQSHAGGGRRAQSPETRDKYQRADGTWDPDRVRDVHEPILDEMTEGVEKAPNGEPVLHMTGGGYGAGKTSVAERQFPDRDKAVHVNPDEIKGGLPEYNAALTNDDPSDDAWAATAVHEESSHIAKVGVRNSLQNGYSTMYDTSGDSSIDKLDAKIAGFREAGASRVEGAYAFPGSVDEAIRRVDARAARTGRFVPHALTRANHAEVSRTWQAAAERRTFDDLKLFSTAGPLGSTPGLIAEARDGRITVHNDAEWKNFQEVGES